MPGYQIPLTTVDANTTINNQKLVTTGNDIGKNYVINGDFSIWQRGTSFTGFGQNADRWMCHDSSGSLSILKTTDGISITGTQSGFSASNSYGALQYNGIESQDIYNALSSGTMVLSWKMKSTANTTIALRFDLYDSTGTRNNYSPVVSVSQSSSFVKYSVVLPQNAIVTKRNYELGLQFQFVFVETRPSLIGGSATAWNVPATYLVPQSINAFSAGNVTFEIADVQLEKGSTPSIFGRRPYGHELALCQRYYWKFNSDSASGNYMPFGAGHGIDSNNARAYFSYPVPMRVSPAISFSAASTFQKSYGTAMTSISSGEIGISSLSFNVVKTSEFAFNQGILITAANNKTAYMEISAEY